MAQAKNYPDIKYNAVLFGGNRFVAVGLGQQTAFSDDGVNWSSASLPTTYEFYSLAYGNGQFAIAGETACGYSNDGRSWNLTLPGDKAVVFANGKFLFYRDAFANVPPSTVHWDTTYNLSSIELVAATNMFVCSATYLAAPFDGMDRQLFYSQDGISWTRADADFFGTFEDLFQVEDAFVRYDWTMTIGGRVLFGPDGSVLKHPPLAALEAFAWDKSTLLCFGGGYSASGQPEHQVRRYESGEWIKSVNPPEIRLTSCAISGNLFVGIGVSNSAATLIPTIVVATDGLSGLTAITLPDGSDQLTSIRYFEGRFVAVGKGGALIDSTDGRNWTTVLPNTTTDLNDLAYANGIWVAVGDAGRIITSTDTSVFTLRSSGTGVPIFGVTYGANQFVAVGKDGLIVTSPNGIDWSATGTDEARDLYSIAYGNNRYVAVGTNGIVHVSTNAIQWQATTIPNVTAFRRVAFGNGSFVALTSTNNFLYASTDGVNWTSTQISDVNLYGLDFSDNELWLTGEKSTIYKTSLSPVLAPIARGELDANKQFVLTIQAAAAGNYVIESSPVLPATAWEALTTLNNVQTTASWTDTNAPTATKFYRVLRQQ